MLTAFATPSLAAADAEAAAPRVAPSLYPEWVLRAEMTLAVIVRFPPLKPKLIERPPFAYVHDLLASMHKKSHLFEQMETELPPNCWSIHTLQSKATRIEFIARLLQHTEARLGRSLGVQPIDVVESRACESTVAWLCEVATLALGQLRPKPIALAFSSANATPDIRTPAYSTFATPAKPTMGMGMGGDSMMAAAATPAALQSPWPSVAPVSVSAATDASISTTGPQTPASVSSFDPYAYATASSSSASSTSSLPPRRKASPSSRRSKHSSRLPPLSPAEAQAREAAATAAALTLLSSLQIERKASPVTVPQKIFYVNPMAAVHSAQSAAPVETSAPAAAVPAPVASHPQPLPQPVDSALPLNEHEIAVHQALQHQALQQSYSQPETVSRRPTPSRSAMLTASLLERLSPPAAAHQSPPPPVLGSSTSPFSRRTPISRTPVLAPAASPLRPIAVQALAAARPSSAQQQQQQQQQSSAHSSARTSQHNSQPSSQHNSRPVTATPDSSAMIRVPSRATATPTESYSVAAALPAPPLRAPLHHASVDPSVQRETRALLRLFLPSGCLPAERLVAPGFPLLHEVLLSIMHETGFAEGILPFETQPHLSRIERIVDDSAAQMLVVQNLIDYMQLALTSIGGGERNKLVVTNAEQLLPEDGPPPPQLAHEFLQQLVTLSLDSRLDKPALLKQFLANVAAAAANEAPVFSAAAASVSSEEKKQLAADEDDTAGDEDDSFPSSACVPPYILSTRLLLAELINAPIGGGGGGGGGAPVPPNSSTAFLEQVLDPLLPLVGFEGFHRIVIMLKARSSYFAHLWNDEADSIEFFYPPASDYRVEDSTRTFYEARQIAFVSRVIRFLNITLQFQQQEELSGYAALTFDLDPALIVSAGSIDGPNPTPLHAEESDYGRQVHNLLQSVIQTAMNFPEQEQNKLVKLYVKTYGSGEIEQEKEEEEEGEEDGEAAAEAEEEQKQSSSNAQASKGVARASASASSSSLAKPRSLSSADKEKEEQERAVEAALRARSQGRVQPVRSSASSSSSSSSSASSSATRAELAAAAYAKALALSSLQQPDPPSSTSLVIPVLIFMLGLSIIVSALLFPQLTSDVVHQLETAFEEKQGVWNAISGGWTAMMQQWKEVVESTTTTSAAASTS